MHHCSVYIIHTWYYFSVNTESFTVNTPTISSTTISRSVTENGRCYMHNLICVMNIKQILVIFNTNLHTAAQLPTELNVIQHVVLPLLITSAVIFIIIIMVLAIIIIALIMTRRKTGVHMIMY